MLEELESEGRTTGFHVKGKVGGILWEAQHVPHKATLKPLIGESGLPAGVGQGEEGATVIEPRGEHVRPPDRRAVTKDRGDERVEEEAEAGGVLNPTSLALPHHGVILGERRRMETRGCVGEALAVVEQETKVAELLHPLKGLRPERKRWESRGGRRPGAQRHELGFRDVDHQAELGGHTLETVKLALEACCREGQEHQVVCIEDRRDRGEWGCRLRTSGHNATESGQVKALLGWVRGLEEATQKGLDEHAKEDGRQRAALADTDAGNPRRPQTRGQLDLEGDVGVVALDSLDERFRDREVSEQTPEERALDRVECLHEIHKGTEDRSTLRLNHGTEDEGGLAGPTPAAETKLRVRTEPRGVQGTREATFKEACVEFGEDGSDGDSTEIRGVGSIALALEDWD
jgi:hypothetical protein